MILTILLILLFAVGLAILILIFTKKLPQLRVMDPSTDRGARSRQLKYEILRQRLERAGGKRAEQVQKNVLSPIQQGFQNAIRKVAGKLTAVERSYQQRSKQAGESKLGKEELDVLVDEGRKALDEEMWDRAEKKFIEVISNDPKNVNAYELLGRLYQNKKDYKLAKQTFQFLKKLSSSDPSVIASLGEIEMKLGNSARALEHFKAAVDLSPKNPKYLDFLVSASLEEKDLHQAQQSLDQLEAVNPDNQKIKTFQEQIDQMRKKIIKKK